MLEQGGWDLRFDKGSITDLGALSWASGWNTQVRNPGDGVDMLLEWPLEMEKVTGA